MKYCLLESEDTNDMGKKRKRKGTITTEKAEVGKLIRDVIADVTSVKEVAEKPDGVTNTNDSGLVNIMHCNSNTLNTDNNSRQSNLGTKINIFESGASNLKFKPYFDRAPVFANSNPSEKCDEEMDWEKCCDKSPGTVNCNVNETDSQPSTSANLDDSVIICGTKEGSFKRPSQKEPRKYRNDSVIEVGEVLVISDTEDESLLQEVKVKENSVSCNSLRRSLRSTKDIICVSSPDLFHVSPQRSFIRPCKRQKKSALDSVPKCTRVVSVSPNKNCTFLGSKSQPELKIVSEVKNVLPLSQTFPLLHCREKSHTTCQQKLCSVHQKFSRVAPTKKSLLQKRNNRGRKFKGKSMRNGITALPRGASRNSGFPFKGPDLCITSEKLVNIATGNSRDEVAICSLRSSVDTTHANLQNKENTACLTRNLCLPSKSQAQKRTLRPVVVDGSNVAYTHGQKNRPKTFSCKGIELCVRYFQSRGHEVTVFVPQYRRCRSKEVVGQEILERLGRQQVVVFTPSRKIDGVLINSYDDRFILDLAARTGGVIVSNDNYRDLKNEKPEWREAVNERLLMYLFVGDHFMVPDDPLGSRGVSLEKFLSFPLCV